MQQAFVLALVTGSAVWVFWDATKNKIGKIEGEKTWNNMSAAAWATVTLLLWIVGLPGYLVSRSVLIERAKQSPVEPKARELKLLVLSVFSLAVTGFAFAAANAQVPQCTDPAALETAKTAIANTIGAGFMQAANPSIEAAQQIAFDSSSGQRTCRAQLRTRQGSVTPFGYSINWQDESKTNYVVQIIR
jgi:hypothetical protein